MVSITYLLMAMSSRNVENIAFMEGIAARLKGRLGFINTDEQEMLFFLHCSMYLTSIKVGFQCF